MYLRNHIFVLIILIGFENALSCTRSPKVEHSRRTRGDNGYKLLIGDSPSGYEAGKTYTLLLLGSRTHNNVQHFTHFTLTAEASNGGARHTTVASPKRVGSFQLYGDSLTKFNDKCINTVIQADDLPKTEVQIMWVAPETGSGCISLSAMVYEGPRSWYADDGALSKVICEKKTDETTIKKECCACNEAKYKFVFEGIWSNETHPKNYPFAVWLTHFSDIVGGSHDTNFSFWGENHIATDGFRSLAEWGSTRELEHELRVKGPRLRTLIKAPGLWYPKVNSNTSSIFKVDRKHHKVSMVSMLGPSPDWVVGINGLDLCTVDCSWKESLDIDLYPWDAGTDSGISYMSPNAATQPRERMYAITTMYPEDPRGPFYNPKSTKMTPVAKLYIRRDKIINKNCDDDFLQALQLDVVESDDQESRPECAVSEYTTFSPCSVTCGKGLRMRSRVYLNPEKAEMNMCDRQLISKEMCVAPIPECREGNNEDDEGENLALSQSTVNEAGDGIGLCTTTQWGDWSECSASCGIGITMRTRTFVNHLGRKRCPHITVVEKQKCMKPECSFNEMDVPDSECPTTHWSDWSPCTATCGKGITIRTRLLLVESDMKEKCSKKKELNEQKECSVKQECSFDPEAAKKYCREQADVGPCRGAYQRFSFNERTRTCEAFIYGGCRGNQNNFLNYEDCMNTCKILLLEDPRHKPAPPTPPATFSRSHDDEVLRNFDNLPQDCLMSEWTQWTPCSTTCGDGVSERYRHVLRDAKNGGIPCQRRQIKRKRCNLREC